MTNKYKSIATRTRSRLLNAAATEAIRSAHVVRVDTVVAPIEVEYFIGSHLENKALKKTLLDEIQSHCKGVVTPTYAKKTIYNADMLLVAYARAHTRLPVGFMVIAPKDNDQLEVKLVCSNGDVKGVGSLLLKKAEEFARTWKKTAIILDALPGAEGFYKKAGFIETGKPCAKRVPVSRSGNAIDGYRYSKCLK